MLIVLGKQIPKEIDKVHPEAANILYSIYYLINLKCFFKIPNLLFLMEPKEFLFLNLAENISREKHFMVQL